jgi:hypothetical protein
MSFELPVSKAMIWRGRLLTGASARVARRHARQA